MAGQRNTGKSHCPPMADAGRLPRLIVCTVPNSRSKGVFPYELMAKKERAKWERFFRDLLCLKPNQTVVIREVYE